MERTEAKLPNDLVALLITYAVIAFFLYGLYVLAGAALSNCNDKHKTPENEVAWEPWPRAPSWQGQCLTRLKAYQFAPVTPEPN